LTGDIRVATARDRPGGTAVARPDHGRPAQGVRLPYR
jgi:hypothetical protein